MGVKVIKHGKNTEKVKSREWTSKCVQRGITVLPEAFHQAVNSIEQIILKVIHAFDACPLSTQQPDCICATQVMWCFQ
jgi:hypothetical protein